VPGQPSEAQPVRISGRLVTGNITVTASPGFEISRTKNGSFSNQLVFDIPYEELLATDIYVRLAAQNGSGNRAGKLTLSSPGAVSKRLALTGHISVPIVRFDRTVVTTFAGGNTAAFTNGNGATARFNAPLDVATDAAGNTYVADASNNSIRKISKYGNVTTLAGNATAGFTDGVGPNAQFNRPTGVGTDKVGNVYVADNGNKAIRKISPDGSVITIASNAGPTPAGFNLPQDVAVDDAGNVFVADYFNHRIYKISTSGEVSVFAGSGVPGTVDGNGTQAQFYHPNRLIFDESGTLFLTESYGAMRKITSDGDVSTVLAEILSGFQDGIASDDAGNVFVSIVTDGDHNFISRITNNGKGALVSGSTRGYVDGTRDSAKFFFVGGIATDNTGNIFAADMNNHRIRKISVPKLYFSTNTGTPSLPQAVWVSAADLTGDATISAPPGFELSLAEAGPYTGTLAVSPVDDEIVSQKIYVRLTGAGSNSTYIGQLAMSAAGAVTQNIDVYGMVFAPDVQFDPRAVATVAGSGTAGFQEGNAESARFNLPKDVTVDQEGNKYVADAANHRIRKIDVVGNVTTLAGTGEAGFTDGNGAQAKFNSPFGVAIDQQGNIYVADGGNHAIRKITPSGYVTTIAGNGTSGFADGPGAEARFNGPNGIAADGDGNLYITEYYNHSVRKLSKDGIVTTLAGNGEPGGVDGSGTNAQFYSPNNIAVDKAGNVYVTEWYAPLRKITPDGNVTTVHTPGHAYDLFQSGVAIDPLGNIILSVILGNGQNAIYMLSPSGEGRVISHNEFGFKDGVTDSARFHDPGGIDIDQHGNIYIADIGNSRIRKISNPVVELVSFNGLPSTPKSFRVSGSKLSGNAQLQAPAAFEISFDSTANYSGSLSATANDGEIFSLKAFVRLRSGNVPGVVEDSVILSSPGALATALKLKGTIVDTIPPVIVCPAPVVRCYSTNNTYTVPLLSASDISGIMNVSYAITGTTNRSGTGTNASGIFNVGRSTIVWTVKDGAGNTSTCSTAVTIDAPLNGNIPNVYPLLVWGEPNTLYLGFGASCVRLTAQASGGTRFAGNTYRYIWSTGATSSFINVCPNVPGYHTYTVRIIDSLGCEVTASKTIRVIDVRCGPSMNRVQICWYTPWGSQQSCVTQGQAALALLLGARLGSCSPTLTVAPPQQRTQQPVDMEAALSELKISPNPNTGVFRVQLNGTVASEIRVLDVNGKVILKQRIATGNKSQSIAIDLGNVPSGVYFVQAVGVKGIVASRIIVQR
jgi:sugar lactone lactonase YvrE